MMINFMGRG